MKTGVRNQSTKRAGQKMFTARNRAPIIPRASIRSRAHLSTRARTLSRAPLSTRVIQVEITTRSVIKHDWVNGLATSQPIFFGS